MNVGVFLSDYSSEVGGGYTFQSDILQSLLRLAEKSKQNFVLVLSGKRKSDRYEITESRNVRIIYYSGPDIIERLLSRIRLDSSLIRMIWRRKGKLDRLAREANIDIMWFISPASADIDTPYINIVWDLQHRLQPWFPEVSEKDEWFAREDHYSRSLQRATFIITGTSVGRKEIERFYQIPSERIKILPHPTPIYALKAPPLDDQAILRKYGIPAGYLLYPAQFWPHKNHANLLASVKILREEQGMVLPAVFVGSDHGNLMYIRRLASELDLSSQVHFLGFVPQEDLVSLYRMAFALTNISFFGPENLPPLEAFALRCPVIASNVAGAKEQLGNAALLVDPKNPHEIANAIKALYDNPKLRSKLIQLGAERAVRWTGEDFVLGVFSILDELEPIRYCWENSNNKW